MDSDAFVSDWQRQENRKREQERHFEREAAREREAEARLRSEQEAAEREARRRPVFKTKRELDAEREETLQQKRTEQAAQRAQWKREYFAAGPRREDQRSGAAAGFGGRGGPVREEPKSGPASAGSAKIAPAAPISVVGGEQYAINRAIGALLDEIKRFHSVDVDRGGRETTTSKKERLRFYKSLCLRWHPDKHAEEEKYLATCVFQVLQEKKGEIVG